MTEPVAWWDRHRMQPPPRTPDMRWAVQTYPWGVAVWEGPTRRAPQAPLRVVDVVLAGPGAPLGLAVEHAVERMPDPGLARRVSASLPFPTSPRSVRLAAAVLGLALVVAAGAEQAWLLLILLPFVVAALLLGDRLPPHDHAAAWRRGGHESAAVPFSGRIVLADALCRRAVDQRRPHAGQLVHAVRVALWTCGDASERDPSPLNRWLGDLARADDLAAEVAAYAGEPARAADLGGPPTVVAQAVSLAPDMVASLASPDERWRGEVLDQLRQLRDACAEAREARSALEATVVRTDEAPQSGPGIVSAPEHRERRDRVEQVLGELRAESGILREVDAELRARDEGDTGP